MRTYATPTGEIVPSVTEILKATRAPADRLKLDQWYADQSPDSSNRLRQNEDSRLRGNAIDAWAKAYFQRSPLPEIDFRFTPFLRRLAPMLERLLADADAILCDRIVYGDGYAGTLDFATCKGGHWTVIDLKTRGFAYPPALTEAFVQTAAYGVALETEGYEWRSLNVIVAMPKETQLSVIDNPELIAGLRHAWAVRLQSFRVHTEPVEQVVFDDGF